MPTVIDNEIRTVAADTQAGFGNRLEAILSEARPATDVEARKVRLLQSYDYHTSVDPFYLSAANPSVISNQYH
ncbi:hypothetical protein [Psychrobacter pygoscelis]|uniref:hypothetical protein n=1 Tax=Psychrobacter pygoscelis TaxID=2488563 RepID=UPI00103BE7F5|nr:hypothetical protein [Psychrobacter pygoscelis]